MELEDFADLLALFAALGGIYHLFRARREALRQHPPLDYAEHSSAASDNWRWRHPELELGLSVVDSEPASRLQLPFRQTGLAMGASLFGYALLGLLLYLILLAVWREQTDWVMVSVPIALFLPLAWVLLNTGSYLTAIELRPDEIRFILSYGIVLHRIRRYRYHKKLHFSGDYQSSLGMAVDQEEPDFQLRLQRRYFLGLSSQHRFDVLCNRSQGSWIVGGLNAWQQEHGR